MKFLGRLFYFILLNLLVHYDGASADSFHDIVRTATGIDDTNMQTSVYLIFVALCLYGIGIFDGANVLYKLRRMENYIAIRCIKEKQLTIYIIKALGKQLLVLTFAKSVVDIFVYLIEKECLISELIIVIMIGVLYFLATMCMGLIIAIFHAFHIKISFSYLLLVVSFVIIRSIVGIPFIIDMLFCPVPSMLFDFGYMALIARLSEMAILIFALFVVLRKREFY
ncbi:MAG: hypothetical protein LBR26_06035 [Prevotella sp.]|jgi:hypothetical protein|nr:hypothetical protein [Prevotella sp.]